MVNATIDNRSFKLASLHPQNEELIRRFDGVENLPPGVRLPDLLQAWGDLYNKQQPAFVTTASEGDSTRHVSLGEWSLC